jgi:hypothetical protein
MNYKSAITEVSKDLDLEVESKEIIPTRLERVIKYSPWPEKPGWVKISYAWEEVPIRGTPCPPLDISRNEINLDHYVRLQEKRRKEYDAMRWPGAYRETFQLDPSVSAFEWNSSSWRKHSNNSNPKKRVQVKKTTTGVKDATSMAVVDEDFSDSDSDLSATYDSSDLEM